MTSIVAAKSLKSLIKGSKTLMVVAPKKAFSTRSFPKILGKRLDALFVELAKDAPPGDQGASATTLSQKEPRRLAVGVLPDDVSRHNTPTRAYAIHNVVSGADLGSKGKAGIVVLLDDANHVCAALNAIGRAFPQYSAKSGKGSTLRVQVFFMTTSGEPLEVDAKSAVVLKAARDSAELVDTPPTDLNPAAFAERAKELLEGTGVTITEFVGDQLLEQGFVGIHSVGRCAMDAPRMVVASYVPEAPAVPEAEEGGEGEVAAEAAVEAEEVAETRHIALVGKGVTYDTGGLHLKGRGSMEGMKCDMGGAAAVLGAFRVLVETKCTHRVTLILCMAENAIGPNSYKPDDVLHMHSGKTVEINNTDAEGRLLLADGVSYAARELEADFVIDAATLTGAQLISTGTAHGAVIAEDEVLERIAIEAGRDCGDLCHPLLFAPEFFRKEFKSAVADMCNSVRNRANAQTSCAGYFVYAHLADTAASWCHIDLAGPAFPNDRGTGYGVALISELVSRIG